jgi:hypothetical protein
VAAVFDAPVPTVHPEQTFGTGLFFLSAGDAIGDFLRTFLGFIVDYFPLHRVRLPDMGKVQTVVEIGDGPNLPRLDAAMAKLRGSMLDVIWRPTTLEEPGEFI